MSAALVPVPKKHLARYKKIASAAGKIWMEHGAVSYCEAVADDTENKWGVSFTSLVKPKAGETFLFSFVVYKNKKHRDKVNALVMKDPRMDRMMDKDKPIFDHTRMAFGGFEAVVNL